MGARERRAGRREPGRQRLILLAPVGALLFALHAAPASAYVRYRTETGLPFRWSQTCVPMTVYPDDSPDLPPPSIINAASGSGFAWSTSNNACTYLDIQVESSTGAGPAAAFDRRNSIVFRKERWCRSNDPTTICEPFDPAALAITSLFVTTRSGEILDADIEVNAAFFIWSDFDADPTPGKQDLQNALTHEMGHLIGLDHNCYVPGSLARPTDQNGQPAVDCALAPAELREATMFPSSSPGDISKRSLAADDQAALCAIYPRAQDPMLCAPPVVDGGAGAGTDAATDAVPRLDASADSGSPLAGGGGCGCAVGQGDAPLGLWVTLMSALALALAGLRSGRARLHDRPAPPGAGALAE